MKLFLGDDFLNNFSLSDNIDNFTFLQNSVYDFYENMCNFVERVNRGVFISFEGGDGSGKSTQAKMLADFFNFLELPVLFTFEPGATELGVILRNLVQFSEINLNPKTEALLYAADRSYHVSNVVKPALKSKVNVITDRYIDSSVAYQGAARELGSEQIENISLWATDFLKPDITVFLEVSENVAKKRLGESKLDKLEAAGDDFHKKVFIEYSKIVSKNENNRFIVVDGDCSKDIVFNSILEALNSKLKILNGGL